MILKIISIIFLLLIGNGLQAQYSQLNRASVSEAIEVDGITAVVSGFVALEVQSGQLMGSQNYRIVLSPVTSRVDNISGVRFNGKTYSEMDFGGRLAQSFRNLSTGNMTIVATISGLKDSSCHQFSVSGLNGSRSTSYFCEPLPNQTPRITSVDVRRVEVSGLSALKSRIQQLEAEQITAQRQAQEQAAAQRRAQEQAEARRSAQVQAAAQRQAQELSSSQRQADALREAEAQRQANAQREAERQAREREYNRQQERLEQQRRENEARAQAVTNAADALANAIIIAGENDRIERETRRLREEREEMARFEAENRRRNEINNSRNSMTRQLEASHSSMESQFSRLNQDRRDLLDNVTRVRAYSNRPAERYAFIVATPAETQFYPIKPAFSINHGAFDYNSTHNHLAEYNSQKAQIDRMSLFLTESTIMVTRPFLISRNRDGFYPMNEDIATKFKSQNPNYPSIQIIGWFSKEEAQQKYNDVVADANRCECKVSVQRTVFMP